MKKRYILFGYQIQNGEFCIVQQEGAAVEYIFDAYSNGDSLQQIATHMSSCGPPYRSSDNRWNKNIIARLLSCDIYCGTATYPAIITKELYFQVQQLRNEKSVSYSSVLQSFRDDMQCCCGERLYCYPKTHQWYCRHCGMWSNRIRPEELSQQLREKLFWIWYDWEHSLPFQDFGDSTQCFLLRIRLSCSHPAVKALLADWRIHRTAFENGRITSSDYLEWMLQWPPTLSAPDD